MLMQESWEYAKKHDYLDNSYRKVLYLPGSIQRRIAKVTNTAEAASSALLASSGDLPPGEFPIIVLGKK
jgi:hypothetical protein